MIDQVREDFGVELTSLVRVVGGADAAAVMWRGVSVDGACFAVKVSRRDMAAGLLVAAHLAASGVRGVPAPLTARSGQLWCARDGAQLSLTPWVPGRRGDDGGLSAEQWRSFGALLTRVHATGVPDRVRARLPGVDYPAVAASTVRGIGARMRRVGVQDQLERALIDDWLAVAGSVAALAEQSTALGRDLRDGAGPRVLCHGDAHIANVVVGEDGQVVDRLGRGGVGPARA